MAYTGGLRRSVIGYVDAAQNLGHGYNPVHEIWGSPSVRTEPYPMRRGEIVSTGRTLPDDLLAQDLWGYMVEDSTATGVDYDGRPAWNEQPPEYRGDTDDHPPYNAPGSVRENFRAMKGGAHRFRQKLADSLPSETVSEGWLNKPKGDPANAQSSDPSQYEMQTSMTQRYKTRVNDAAVDRGTDAARSPIESRVEGQKLKVYSGGLRHYDMFPKQQNVILRPFSYRTAGTGPARYLTANAYAPVEPIERVPPPDPYIGQAETDMTEDYGYTPEDYYAY